MLAKKVFKEIVDLCYEEDYPELHQELVSLEVTLKKTKDYENGIGEAIQAIQMYTEDFPEDVMEDIENIHQEYLDSLEN